MIPYGKQKIDKSDIKEVTKAIKESLLTTGPKVEKFQNEIKKYTNAKYSVVCNSGTSALYLAFLSINLKPGDVVVMPAVNFIASFNICKILKAKIYLADIDPVKGIITPENLNKVIKKNNLKNIKVVITMHMGGKAENVGKFFELKKRFKFKIIEDSCHAFGSKYTYKKKLYNVGCAKHADISTFSFHPIKTITTGEGGAITTNNKNLFHKINLFKSHGIIRSKQNKHWEYDIKTVGLNFRLSDINCALGLSQLKKINSFLTIRKNIAKLYEQEFRKLNLNISFPEVNKVQNAWHLYIINYDFKNLKNKDNFFRYLKKNKIIAQYHYIPIYRLSIGNNFRKLPGSEKYYKNSVSLPIFVGLKKKHQLLIINKIKNYLTKIN